MPPHQCYTPLLAFKSTIVLLHILFTHKDHASFQLSRDAGYGLSSAIFSQDVKHALALSRKREPDICHINGPTVADEAQMPFGGVKSSGFFRPFGSRL